MVYDKSEMTWLDLSLPMRIASMLRTNKYDAMVGTYVDQAEDEYFGEDWMNHFAASQILDAKHEKFQLTMPLNSKLI